MAETHVITALVAKRSEIAGLIISLEKQIHTHQAALAHIDAALRLFDPSVKLAGLAPKRPPHARSPYFAQGEIADRCRKALRAGGEVTSESVAVQAMKEKGLDPTDRKLRSDFVRRILWALQRMNQRGTLDKVGERAGVRWVLPQDGPEAS
jgi:hypothetical protein